MAQETLGKLLKEAREKRRWSQAKLAGQLGIVSQTILRWEQDKSVPREDCRQPLIELLGLDEEVFLHAKKPKIHEKVDISETTVHEENVEQQEATDFVEVIVPLVKVYHGWSTTSDTADEKYVTVDDRPLPYVHFDRSGYIVADASGHLNWGYTGGGPGNLALSLFWQTTLGRHHFQGKHVEICLKHGSIITILRWTLSLGSIMRNGKYGLERLPLG